MLISEERSELRYFDLELRRVVFTAQIIQLSGIYLSEHSLDKPN